MDIYTILIITQPPYLAWRGNRKVWEKRWVGQLSSPSWAVHSPMPRPRGPLESTLVVFLPVSFDLPQGSLSDISGVSHISMQSLLSSPEVLPSKCLQECFTEHLLCVSSQKPLFRCAPKEHVPHVSAPNPSPYMFAQKPLPTSLFQELLLRVPLRATPLETPPRSSLHFWVLFTKSLPQEHITQVSCPSSCCSCLTKCELKLLRLLCLAAELVFSTHTTCNPQPCRVQI